MLEHEVTFLAEQEERQGEAEVKAMIQPDLSNKQNAANLLQVSLPLSSSRPYLHGPLKPRIACAWTALCLRTTCSDNIAQEVVKTSFDDLSVRDTISINWAIAVLRYCSEGPYRALSSAHVGCKHSFVG